MVDEAIALTQQAHQKNKPTVDIVRSHPPPHPTASVEIGSFGAGP